MPDCPLLSNSRVRAEGRPVVDAMAFGEGASGRNGGGVSAGINIGKGQEGGPGQQTLSDAYQKTVVDLISESLAAFEFVQTLIRREGIECHFERRGRFVGAFPKPTIWIFSKRPNS